ncbi:MAG: DegT/DnrJ/EryC1/StrS family aminotransferase [Chloroflexi bacterium]|nr:DegT/DnrJ/EryC1/StrS family aminotransferase [Chloroflexota bacterium]
MDFFKPYISEEGMTLVAEALRSTFISEGKMVARFESELQRSLGLVNPVAVNSGTSALHLALSIIGVQEGDEVILPPQTFVATGTVILHHRATPVFADIQLDTGNIDPKSVEAKITERTRAIIMVHWGGYPCDIDEINEIAARHGIAVIEDAAQALGATYKRKPVGSISRFTAFSFQAIKHLTTGDGGALCCLDEGDHEKARALRWFGIDRARSEPSELGERIFDISTVGYKFHMNDLAAALGFGNLSGFGAVSRRRKDVAVRYRAGLSGIAGLDLFADDPDRESANWLFTVLVRDRLRLIRKLKSDGIPASVVHQRIDRNSIFGTLTADLPNQEKFDDMQVSLPIHHEMTDEDIDQVINSVRQGW